MPKMTNQQLIQANAEHWALASFHPDALAKAKPVAQRLVAAHAKVIYEQIEADTGVPWFIVAVIHEREASQRWDRQLGQGDPLNEVSRHVPKGWRGLRLPQPPAPVGSLGGSGPGGVAQPQTHFARPPRSARGPFDSFIAGAVDALKNCAPYLGRWRDWSPGGALTATELYNGEGYENYHHMASPYVWGGSDIYHTGKYVADGQFDADVVDSQLGTAVLLKEMMLLDSSIQFQQPGAKPAAPVETQSPKANENGEEHDQPPAPKPAPPPAASPAAEEEQPNPNEGKPAHKSKITWLSYIMSFLGLGGLTGNLQDATLDSVQEAVNTVHDKAGQVQDVAHQVGLGTILAHAVARPNFLLFAGIAVVGVLIAFFWYRDHGPGSVK